MEYEKIAARVLLQNKREFILCKVMEEAELRTGWHVVDDGCVRLKKDTLRLQGVFGLRAVVHEEDAVFCEAFLEELSRVLQGETWNPELQGKIIYLRLVLDDHTYRYLWHRIEVVYDAREGEPVAACVVRIAETTAEERYRLELARTITNDRNPAYFVKGAEEMIKSHPEYDHALIQFDVAKFKMINEQYGEQMGDELLGYFINVLDMLCTPSQLFVRLMADVFMILMPYQKEEEIEAFVETLRDKLTGYKGIPYTLYFGVSLIENPDEPLRRYGDGAALARQSIKGDALRHIAFYKTEMRELARMKKFIEDNMEQALENGEFEMYLQPKFCISEHKIIGAEGLVRWNSEKYGLIAPNDFIPLFEQNGFVIRLDAYIWEEACKTLHSWKAQGYPVIPISVNMSRRHLLNTDFIDVLEGLVDKYQIQKSDLEIELTETLEENQVVDAVSLLKEHGFHLLMDDFGSGYSSLNTLKDTQFDVVKIDRIFLKDFLNSKRGRKIVEHTIRMTSDIGLDMIAEGVETREQAYFLEECGCDKAQGYYYDKPIPRRDFEEKYIKG